MNSAELREQIKEEFRQLKTMMRKEMEDFLKSRNLDGDVILTRRNGEKIKGVIKILYNGSNLYPLEFSFYPYKKNGELSLKSKFHYFGLFGENNFEKYFEAFKQYIDEDDEGEEENATID